MGEEENEEKQGGIKNAMKGGIKNALGNQAKKATKDAAKKLVKQVIKVIAKALKLILSKLAIPILLVILLAGIIKFLLDSSESESGKKTHKDGIQFEYVTYVEPEDLEEDEEDTDADANSDDDSKDEDKDKTTPKKSSKVPTGYKVTVIPDIKGGGYKLQYAFYNKKGKKVNIPETLESFKGELKAANRNPEEFTDSELKILQILVFNGLELKDYNEEELQCLALFYKADIAGQCIDLRGSDVGATIDVEKVREQDYVYGTIQVVKQCAEEKGYSDLQPLTYKPYEEFQEWLGKRKGQDFTEDELKEFGSYFTLDKDGSILCSKVGQYSLKVNYLSPGEQPQPLTDVQMEQIPEDERLEDEKLTRVDDSQPLKFKKKVSIYSLKYGLMLDLLIATRNPEFCSELAELAFNSKIVIRLKETTTIVNSHTRTTTTNTVKKEGNMRYLVTGTKSQWQYKSSGSAATINDVTLDAKYGWNPSKARVAKSENGDRTYYWNGDKYKIFFKASATTERKRWTFSALEDVATEPENDNAPYYSSEAFTYILDEEMYSMNHGYSFDIYQIDTWFVKYLRPYEGDVEVKPNEDHPEPSLIKGEFVLDENSPETITDRSIIDNDSVVSNFKIEKIQEYMAKPSNRGAKDVNCEVSKITFNTYRKQDEIYETLLSSRDVYKFGKLEDENVDLTQVDFKNVLITDDKATYTEKDENGNDEHGFLYVYDHYRLRKDLISDEDVDSYMKGEDVFLEEDVEKELFSLLEADNDTLVFSSLIKWLLYVYDGRDRGITDIKQIRIMFKVRSLDLTKTLSPFGHKLTKEEFVEKAQAYTGGDDLFKVTLVESFYDICLEYNVNPCLAYAWAAIESAWGSKAPYYNLFGFGIGNGQSEGVRYTNYDDSIRDFCKWIVDSATPGTKRYEGAATRGEEFAEENDKFNGTPENNIYCMFSTYMFLGKTHICDDPNTDDPEKFQQACIDGNSTNGSGGRLAIYKMYELGGLYTGEYKIRCGHKKGTDPTTIAEQADYSEYSLNNRINLAKQIFGNGCLVGSFGLVEAAFEVARHYLDGGPTIYYGGSYKWKDDPHGLCDTLQETWDIQENGLTGTKGIVCATFVSLAIWKAELADASWIESQHWHAVGIGPKLTKLPGWIHVGDGLGEDELEEGDVMVTNNGGHIVIYVGEGQYIDQTYCAGYQNGHLHQEPCESTKPIEWAAPIGGVYRYDLDFED